MKNNETIKEIESKLISGMLTNATIADEAILELHAKDFSDQKMAIVFSVISLLQKEGKKNTIDAVISYIDAHEELQFEHYQITIRALPSSYVSEDEAKQLIDIINASSRKSQLNAFAKEVLDNDVAFVDIDDYMDKKLKDFSNIVSAKRVNKDLHIGEVATTWYANLEKEMYHEGNLKGVSSGFNKIDNATNGFQPGEMIILAARPGVGKTALSLNFLYNAARNIDPNKNEIVWFLSLEMSAEQICNRLISLISGVELSNYSRSRLNNNRTELDAIHEAKTELSKLPIWIDDDASLNISDIHAKVKQKTAEKNIRLLVIDYLGLIKDSKVRGGNYSLNQEISFISGELKKIARIYNIPILVLCQLNRRFDERGATSSKKGDNPIKKQNKEPLLSDLRDSGAIEQDADIVSFLYDNSGDTEVENPNNKVQQVIFSISKNRNGSQIKDRMIFKKDTMQFVEINSQGEIN